MGEFPWAVKRFPFRKVQLRLRDRAYKIACEQFPFRKVQLRPFENCRLLEEDSKFPFRKVQLRHTESGYVNNGLVCFHSARYN